MSRLDDAINLRAYPIMRDSFITACKKKFEKDGLLLLDKFLMDDAIETLVEEA